MRIGPLAVLRERQFTILWCSLLVSDMGTWMQIAALGIYVAQTTGQASWVGLITTATYLAAGLVAPFGGAFADRYDRRIVVRVGVLGQAIVSLLLVAAIATQNDGPLVLWVLAGLQGLVGAAVFPALNAMVPDLVSATHYSQAMSLYHVSWNIGRSLGPLLAVLAIATVSFEAVFLFNGVSFLTVAIATTALSETKRGETSGSALQRLREGFRGLTAAPACRTPLATCIAHAALIAPFIALIPVMSQLTLGGRASDTGHLYAAQGIGSILGVLVIASLIPRLGQARVLTLALLGAATCAIAYSWSPTILSALLWIIPLSGFHSSVVAGCAALLVGRAPTDIRGRIMGFYNASYNLTLSASGVIMAILADHFGVRIVLFVGALAMIAGVAFTQTRAVRP